MLLNDLIAVMERIAPPSLALDFDNPGLLIGRDGQEISKALVALDCTEAVAAEAAALGAELVITHHPLFFSPVRQILPNRPDTAPAYRLIQHGIALYAAHTNLDAAVGGVNDVLAGLYALTDVVPFGDGMGRIGSLPSAVTMRAFAARTNELLRTRCAYTGSPDRPIRRVAVLGGAGGDELAAAAAAGADAFVTGEIKHHIALEAVSLGVCAVAAGHYETENVMIRSLIDRLQRETNDVQYYEARSGVGPFVRV